MTPTHFAEGQVLFREGDPSDSVFRVLSGAVEVFREIDGEPFSLVPLAPGSLSGRWALWKTAPAARPFEPRARLR